MEHIRRSAIKIRESKALSTLAVLGIYIAAGLLGAMLYISLPWAAWISLLAADIAATAFVFVFSVLFRNASVYDPYWSVFPPIAMTLICLGKHITPLSAVQLIIIWLWGIRLTGNWLYTFQGLRHQDWRYTMLEKKTGRLYPLVNFFGIHLVPTLIVFFCVLPAVYTSEHHIEGSPLSALFLLMSLGAIVLQATADLQMHAFRKTHQGSINQTGLWTYSRHPNYLGEILMWWGIAMSVVCVAQDRIWLIMGAVVNTALFLFVSIPLADQRQSLKPGYDAYAQHTWKLLPIRHK
ncbi:MAG: DUF1295 domain-containing protein [Clostridia bacterium]|nr:DUF1295 domain-containing protein [Clostridia bacterium]